MVKVFVVDDHPLFLQGVAEALLLDPGISLAGTAQDGHGAQQLLPQLHPDLVLVDLWLPDVSGVELSAWLQKALPRTRVLWTSNSVTDDYIQLARSLGVKGFISKCNHANTYARVIRDVAEGQECWVFANGLTREQESFPRHGVLSLTQRQKQIAQLVAAGLPNKQIADRLKIAKRTVDTHRTYIYRKLNVHSAAQLTRFCMENMPIEPNGMPIR